MFILAAAVFLFRHAAFSAFIAAAAKKIHTCFFTHAVMNLHGNA